jgi:hypothetical protein
MYRLSIGGYLHKTERQDRNSPDFGPSMSQSQLARLSMEKLLKIFF